MTGFELQTSGVGSDRFTYQLCFNHCPTYNNFVYSDVSSNSDLNQLIFILRNGGLFVVNRDTLHRKHA